MNNLKKRIYLVYNFIRAFAVKLYLLLKLKFCKKNRFSANRKVEVIVSLTSYHKRFSTLKWTLESLMQQNTDICYKVVLVLSQEDIDIYGGKPKYLNDFQKRGLEILIVKENLRSYKKAYYTYELGLPLITADDDVYYPSWWLGSILVAAKNNPNVILAYRGHYILKNDSEILSYFKWMKCSNKNYIDKPLISFLPTGTSGVYYPVSSLDGLKESKDIFLKLCPDADDLWFKYLTVKNGFRAKRIEENNIHFIILSEGSTLWDVNVNEGGNDVQFNRILNYDLDFKNKILNTSISLDKMDL